MVLVPVLLVLAGQVQMLLNTVIPLAQSTDGIVLYRSNRQEDSRLKRQGSHMLPHGPNCLAPRSQTHDRALPNMCFMSRWVP